MTWVNSVLAENINAVRVVQSFAREQTNYTHFNQVVNKYNLDANMDVVRTISLFFPAVDFLGKCRHGTGDLVWRGSGAWAGDHPRYSGGFRALHQSFFDPIRDLTQRYDNFERTMTSGERIVSLLQEDVVVQDLPEAIELPPIQGKVVFDDVSFRYEEDGEQYLSHIQLTSTRSNRSDGGRNRCRKIYPGKIAFAFY